jgi:hypothetical protein
VNESDSTARGRILDSQLGELERVAGVAEAARRLREPALHPDMNSQSRLDEADAESLEHPRPLLLDATKRRELRALYFRVSRPAQRKALISKQREVELFERTRARVRLDDARRHLEAIRRRPSEGWWIASIVGATLMIVGYWLFALAGALAGGVAALFVGNGIEQAARRRYDQSLAFATEEVDAAEAAAAIAQQSRDLFSERESETAEPDRPLEEPNGLSATAS